MLCVSPPPARIQLRVLGALRLSIDGQPPAGKVYGKMLALLAYLAVEHSRSHGRERLAELFWPELAPDAARTNLRQTLYHLRRLLQDDGQLLLTERESVRLAPEAGLWLDLRALLAVSPCAHSDACQDCGARLEQMEYAASLYDDAFLSGLLLDDAPAFDAWRDEWRSTLHQHMLTLLARLRDCHEQRGALEPAITYATRYTVLEPWDEAGQRERLRLLAAAGRHSDALHHYGQLCRLLQTELGVEPESATEALAARIRAAHTLNAPALRQAEASAPRRRPLTVLYCRLSVPTLPDPEDLAASLRAAAEHCASLLRQHGGHLLPSVGGAVLACFGYPVAAEDAARRAVQAALAVCATGEGPSRPACAIHTATVVTGGAQASPDPDGIVGRQAMLLGEQAAPGSTLISAATQRLLRAYFDLRPLAAPQSGYLVQGPSPRAADSGVLPLVGRDAELAQLHALRDQATDGHSARVVLRGEPGIGKSRLLQALRTSLPPQDWAVCVLHCQQAYRDTPLQPVIALLEGQLGCSAESPPAERQAQLQAYLAQHAPALQAQAPLLEALLAPAAASPSPSPALQRQQTHEALVALLRAGTAGRPLLLVVEDLHWADPSTLTLLASLHKHAADLPMLAAYSLRSDAALPVWLEDAPLLELAPLSAHAMAALVHSADARLDAGMVERIVARAEGIPLFAEELAHHAGDAGSGWDQVPVTLDYLLAARLDTAAPARRLAQLAATIGRSFDHELLSQLVPAPDAQLALLLQNGLVVPAGAQHYAFRHALIQQAAYQGQTRADRRAAHAEVATALIEHFPQRAAQRPAVVAHHLSEAGQCDAALPWWLAAGRRDLASHACAEAAVHLRRGLELFDQLAPPQQSTELELALLLALGQALLALHGYGAAEAAAVFDRALPLCDAKHAPAPAARFGVLWGQWMVSSSRSNASFRTSACLVPALLETALASGDALYLGHAHAAAANLALWQARHAEAYQHAQAAMRACRGQPRQRDRYDGHDPEVAAMAYASWSCQLQGKLNEAFALADGAIALARQLQHPDSLCFALVHAATVRRWQYERAAVIALARETLELAERHSLALWQVAGTMLMGWSQAHAGDRSGLAMLAFAAEAVCAVMPGIQVAFLHPLAEACGFLGDDEAQLRQVEQALATADRLDEHLHRADLHRLRGESLLRLGRDEEGRAALLEAMRLSRRQGIAMVTLRAEQALQKSAVPMA